MMTNFFEIGAGAKLAPPFLRCGWAPSWRHVESTNQRLSARAKPRYFHFLYKFSCFHVSHLHRCDRWISKLTEYWTKYRKFQRMQSEMLPVNNYSWIDNEWTLPVMDFSIIDIPNWILRLKNVVGHVVAPAHLHIQCSWVLFCSGGGSGAGWGISCHVSFFFGHFCLFNLVWIE